MNNGEGRDQATHSENGMSGQDDETVNKDEKQEKEDKSSSEEVSEDSDEDSKEESKDDSSSEEEEEKDGDKGRAGPEQTTAPKLNAGGFPSISLLRTPAPTLVPPPSPITKRPLCFNQDADDNDARAKRARTGDCLPAPPILPLPQSISLPSTLPPTPSTSLPGQALLPSSTAPALLLPSKCIAGPSPATSSSTPLLPTPTAQTPKTPAGPKYQFPSLDNLPELDVHFGRLGIKLPHLRANRRRSISPAPLPGLTVPLPPRNRAVSQMPDAQSTPAGGFTELLSTLKDWESPVYKPKETTAPTQATGATQSSTQQTTSKTTSAPKESPLPPTTVLKLDDPANRDLLERHIGAYGKGQFSNLTWIKTARLVTRTVVRSLQDIPLRTDKMTKHHD